MGKKEGNFSSTVLGATKTRPNPKKDMNFVSGIYLAKVVNNADEFLTGSIEVEIPSLYRSTGKGVISVIKVQYSTPFGGISPNLTVKPENTEKYENTQQSYGMWLQPPDVGSMVLVAFADGNMKHGYIISHVLKPEFNHMLPGLPGGKSFQGGDFLTPVAEKNQYSEQPGHDDILRPIHHDMAEAITKQGLINDAIRGPGTQGARRDTPSQVLGILSKGPRDKDGRPSGAGHSFVMDDEPTSSLIRLRSSKGQQILLDDVTGSIYMINKDGKAWFELDQVGNINIFGEGDMNIRAKKNFNLRADYDVNIEAGQNIRMKAAGDNIAGDYQNPKLAKLGLPGGGTGGNINFHANNNAEILATRNIAMSAIGADIDINCGNMLKTQSGTATSISATTMGVDINAKAGVVAMHSPTAVGINGGADVGIAGAKIRLNTGPGVVIPGLDVLKVTASPLDGNEQKDQGKDMPEYDRESENPLTSGGKRTGKKDKIKTIVQTLVTSEPYAGHGMPDPTTEDPNSISEDTGADKETMEGQISPDDESPADSVTPQGDKVGNGYTDPKTGETSGAKGGSGSVAGAVTSAASGVSSAVGGVNSAIGGVNSAIGGVTGAIDGVTGAIGGQIGNLMNMIPNMEDVKGMLSNFLPASLQSLASIQSLDGLIATMGIAIPAFRFPTGNAIGDKIIGVAKQLKEVEARLGQFSLDGFGLPIDLDLEEIKKFKDDIKGVVNEVNALKDKAGQIKSDLNQLKDTIDPLTGKAGDAGAMGVTPENYAEVKAKLSEKGIDLTVDGPSLIFTDRKTGNTVVDISNGIGPTGQNLGLMSTLQQSKKQMQGLVTVDLSENQTLALVSFISHIGIGNFANSEALVQLNYGNYDQVPRCMKRWRTGRISSGEIVVREDYVQRRAYECELFTTPDWLGLTKEELGVAGPNKNLSFGQLRSMLQIAKENKYRELGIIV